MFFLFSIISLIFWHNTLNQFFWGEGFYYFIPVNSFISHKGIFSYDIWQYDNFARLLFDVLPIFLKDNLKLYFLFQLVILSLLGYSLFFVIRKITSSTAIATLAPLLFLSSYPGLFEMLAEGNYQRFVQRIPNFIPLLFSFYFLSKYLTENNIKLLFTSLVLFVASMFMAHYSTFLTPLFLFYILFTTFSQNLSQKSIIKAFSLIILFTVINLLILSKDPHTPPQNPSTFFRTQQNIFENTIFQLTAITSPPQLIPIISKNFTINTLAFKLLLTKIITLIIVLLLVLGGRLVSRAKPKILPLYLTTLLSAIASMFLYIYTDDKIDMVNNFGQGRALFVPTMLISINFAILFSIIFIKNKILKIISITILLLYLSNNYILISKNAAALQNKFEAHKIWYQFITSQERNFNSQTTLYLPPYLAWPSFMAQQFRLPKNIIIIVPTEENVADITNNWNNKYIFDYDYKNNEILDLTPHEQSQQP